MTRCTGQHANNHHTSTQRCVSRPTQLAQPPECGEKPSAENVTGADTQPSPKGKCQRHKCQADHQNNTLCHLPLPVATSSRKSRTKIAPPRKQIGCAASPPPTSRWGALDSTRGRLCCSYRACQIDRPRERRVHRRPTANRSAAEPISAASPPPSNPPKSAPRNPPPEVRAMQLAALAGNQPC